MMFKNDLKRYHTGTQVDDRREEESATKEQGAVHVELETTPQCCQRRQWRLPNKYQVSTLVPECG